MKSIKKVSESTTHQYTTSFEVDCGMFQANVEVYSTEYQIENLKDTIFSSEISDMDIEFIMDANTITSDEVGVIVGIALGVLLLLIIIGELLRRSARNTDLDELGARTMNVR